MHKIALPCALALSLSFGFCTLAVSAPTCVLGAQKLADNEPCIPDALFNYLYCLAKSGGGKVEVFRKEDSIASRNQEASVSVGGSNVVLGLGGSAGLKRSDVSRVVREIGQKIDPSLASRCDYFARAATSAADPGSLWPRLDGAYVAISPELSPNLEVVRFAKNGTLTFMLCTGDHFTCATLSSSSKIASKLAFTSASNIIHFSWPVQVLGERQSTETLEYRLSNQDGRLIGHTFMRDKPGEPFRPDWARDFTFIPDK